jgi:hypothetical protein
VVARITIVNVIIVCFCKKVFMADRILIFEYSTFRYAVAIGLKHYREAISKIYLTSNYGVADLLKMLTYYRVCCAFSSVRAIPAVIVAGLSLNGVCIFEIVSGMAQTKSGFSQRPKKIHALCQRGGGSSPRKNVKRDLRDKRCLV